MSNNRIHSLDGSVLRHAPHLVFLDLRGNPIKEIHKDTFRTHQKLRKLILSNLRELKEFPDLNSTRSLEVLRLDRAHLKNVPSDLCQKCPKLKSLDMKSNQLSRIPDLRECRDLRVLDLASNAISSLSGQPFKNLGALHDLLLSHNNLRNIPKDAFVGLTRLQVLDLTSNNITDIPVHAFHPFSNLEI
ncbi:leucine-rich repeat-containing G-protein coupled receptor 6, partial [Orussus abietinus]|uniref:leucine-rich repeat-containing G-protein coupled receptor 6 n=1 Tax=Orussus abietinus TaxID=222816 RepID=UPI000C715CC4